MYQKVVNLFTFLFTSVEVTSGPSGMEGEGQGKADCTMPKAGDYNYDQSIGRN